MTKLKQVHQKPPNWEILEKQFGVQWGKVVVTWGDTCYCEKPLSDDLVVHESVHVEQQKNPSKWWERYYKDPEFRLSQELEAYKAQYKYLRGTIKNRNKLFQYRDSICRSLSGKTYGQCISYQEAMKEIM